MFIVFQKDGKENLSLRIVVDKDTIMDELQKVREEHDPLAYITTSIPEDRIFRNAWCKCPKGRAILIEEGKAQNLHMDRIRQVRDKKLKELDGEQIRNLTNPEKLQQIEDDKQKLRDIPQTIDISALDIKKPHKLWPDGLALHRDYVKDPDQ